ncbi:hypothetical protein ABI59_03605 [Acidobacteria bacterium Mor1]|nr:hypothetical protein ABI59_03605 [Acidobacteria bacterium Mor1]
MRLLGILFAVGLASQLGGAAHKLTEEGNREFAEGRLEEALKAYTEAQVHSPESPELYYDVGNVLYRQGDYVAAQEAFERAMQNASDELRADALFNAGNALYRQEDYEGAIERYRDVLGLDPEDVDAKRNLELALRQMQQQQQPQQSPSPDSEEGESDKEPQQQPGDSESDENKESENAPSENSGEPKDPEQGEQRANQPGKMTPEEAQRLLDALLEQERQEAKERAKKVKVKDKGQEKDW